MTTTRTMGAVLLTGAILLVCAGSPTLAASNATNAFLTNVVPDVDFLDRSSRFAIDHTKNQKIRAFARTEAIEQTLAANVVDDWIEKDTSKTVVAEASAPAPNPNQVETGRSVAVDQPAPANAAQMPPAVSQEDVDSIDGLTDQEFDDAYKAKQLMALTQLEANYADYSVNGDDPTFKAMALSELPKIKRRLAELRRL